MDLKRTALLITLACGNGCSDDGVGPDASFDASSRVDAAPDADLGPDAYAACTDWTDAPTYFNPCAIPPPGASLALDAPGTYVYDTSDGSLVDPSGESIFHTNHVLSDEDGEIMLVSTRRVEIAAGTTLRAVGSRPLILVAWGPIVVDGTIDVSSTRAGPGAGASPANLCENSAGGMGIQYDEGGGGGAGGGFNGQGGQGGRGGETVGGLGLGGNAGLGLSLPDRVRGGCRGGRGGAGDRGDGSGGGGPGGGAIQLTALTSITVDGVIHAGGGGGGGADADIGGVGQSRRGGGGGGGSGGLIGLQSAMISIGAGAVLASNGGGGGGGGSEEGAEDGGDGAVNAVNAAGGAPDLSSGAGGQGGAYGDAYGGEGGSGFRGGGGGGGSVGYILIDSPAADIDGNAVISPPALTM